MSERDLTPGDVRTAIFDVSCAGNAISSKKYSLEEFNKKLLVGEDNHVGKAETDMQLLQANAKLSASNNKLLYNYSRL
jgi:hypothetical protein